MRIVIDTNRIMAAVLKESVTRKIIFSKKINFVTPDGVKEEVIKYKNYLSEKTGLNSDEIETLFSKLMNYIRIIPTNTIQPYMEKADSIMRDIDLKDSIFIACALAVKCEGIFSHDKHFEKQNKIKIWKIEDLLEII